MNSCVCRLSSIPRFTRVRAYFTGLPCLAAASGEDGKPFSAANGDIHFRQAMDNHGVATYNLLTDDAIKAHIHREGATMASDRRLNVRLSEEGYLEIKRLAESQDKTISRVIHDSLSLEKYFHEVQSQGGQILVQRKGEPRPKIVVLPR